MKLGSMMMALAVLLLGLALAAGPARADQVARMSADDLVARLGSPDLVVLDVRTSRDWDSSAVKIKGAVRQDPQEVATWAKQHDPAKLYVLYCS